MSAGLLILLGSWSSSLGPHLGVVSPVSRHAPRLSRNLAAEVQLAAAEEVSRLADTSRAAPLPATTS